MLQANGRLGTHAWRLGGTGRRLGHTSTLTVTGDLLANSVLARHIPGSLDALYPEAWLEHRMDSEEQVIRETEEVRLTQLTLKLALELSQYFLTQGERSQTMQITSLSQTLTSCLTALETQNRELTKELRQHVERMLRSHQQMLLREQTVERTERVLRENSAHHTDHEVRTDTASHSNTVAYEKSTQHTDTEVRKETASHTDTVIRGEGVSHGADPPCRAAAAVHGNETDAAGAGVPRHSKRSRRLRRRNGAAVGGDAATLRKRNRAAASGSGGSPRTG